MAAPGRRRKALVAVALDLGPPRYPRLYLYPCLGSVALEFQLSMQLE